MNPCLWGKYLNKVVTYVVDPNFIKFAVLKPHSVTITAKLYIVCCGKQTLEYLSRTIFQPLPEETAKCHCVALSLSILQTHFFTMIIFIRITFGGRLLSGAHANGSNPATAKDDVKQKFSCCDVI